MSRIERFYRHPRHRDVVEARFWMTMEQKGRCAICRKKVDRLLVDHCHETLLIRGLLCNNCNVRLGWYEKYHKAIKRYMKP